MILLVTAGWMLREPLFAQTPSPSQASTSVSSASPVPPAPPASSAPTASPSAVPSPPAPDSAAALALEQLQELDAHPDRAPIGYDRDLFGDPWTDVDRNGCDTRNDILGRDLLNPVFKPGTRDCKVLSGVLIDPYDGSAVDFVSGQNTSVLVQIDHVVALGWAWEHGAYAWTDQRRVEFANDPRNLLAASQEMNQAKGASGPADWLPPVPALACLHVERFVAVLHAYDLGIDDRDRAAARAVLEGCS